MQIPKETFKICYNNTTHNIPSLLHQDELCRHCNKKGTVPLYYLSIKDKIVQWCSSEDVKMLAH